MSEQPNKTKQQLLDELNAIVSMLGDDSIPTLDSVVSGPENDSAASAEQDSSEPSQAADLSGISSEHAFESESDATLESELEESEREENQETEAELEETPEADNEPEAQDSEEPQTEQAQTAETNTEDTSETEELNLEASLTDAHEEETSHFDQQVPKTLLNADVSDSIIPPIDSVYAAALIDEQVFEQEPSAIFEQAPSAVFEHEPSTAFEQPKDEEDDWMTTLELNSADLEEPATNKSFTEAEPGLEIENLLLNSLAGNEAEPAIDLDEDEADQKIQSFKRSNTDTGFNNVIASLLTRPKIDYRRNNPFERTYPPKPAKEEPNFSSEASASFNQETSDSHTETPSVANEASATESGTLNSDDQALHSAVNDAESSAEETLVEGALEPSPATDSLDPDQTLKNDLDLSDDSDGDKADSEFIPEPDLQNEFGSAQLEELASPEQNPFELSGNQFEIAIPDVEAPESEAPGIEALEVEVLSEIPETEMPSNDELFSHLPETTAATDEPILEPEADSGSVLSPTPSDSVDSIPAPQQFTLDDALEGDYYPESGEFQYSFDVNPFGPYQSSPAPFTKPKLPKQSDDLATLPTPTSTATAKQAAVIDQLVAEYLPQIETKLRQRLLALLAEEVDF